MGPRRRMRNRRAARIETMSKNLQIEYLTLGTGESPAAGDVVTVHYTGERDDASTAFEPARGTQDACRR
mgnify:CR=1 FL=1